MIQRFVTSLSALIIGFPLFGWGLVGHSVVNEAATFGAPAEMPRFFHEAYPQLVWLGYEPDRWRGAGDSIDAFNAPNHFLDYEFVADLDLPPSRYDYIELLHSSGTLEEHDIEIDSAGFLPWRLAEVAEKLEREWRNWSREDLSEGEREAVESSIIFLSGVLGHYAGDSANPHHATRHYNGWSLAPAPPGFATDCSTHFRFETLFVTKVIDRNDVFAALSPISSRDDYFTAGVEMIRTSNSLVEDLYALDAAGELDPEMQSEEAREFAVRRLAAGASLLRDLWWTAYVKGTSPRD